MAGNIIFNVFVKDIGVELAKARKLGFSEKTAIRILTDEVQRVAKLGVDIVKASVPRDTEQLRNAIKQRPTGQRTSAQLTGTLSREVFIDPSLHTSSETNLQLSNPLLADILNEGFAREVDINVDVFRKKKRSRVHNSKFHYRKGAKSSNSISAVGSKGDETEDWLTYAQDRLVGELNNGR